jgi:UDP-glucuronate 4-epimerase
VKILVTGVAGFIGFHLSKSLLDDGYEVLGIDNLNDYYDPKLKHARLNQLIPYKNFTFQKIDIADRALLTHSFNSFNPNKVVNLAAQAGVRYSIENPYAYMNSNLVGFLNIIELCRHNDVEGLIYASSSSVYGGNEKIPFSVEDRVDKPLALYGVTKIANELIAQSYSNLYGLHTTGLRYFTVYGPWGRPDMAMYIFTKKILKGKPIHVYNNGKMKRDFTYIKDIIAGTYSAIKNNYECEIFNLGNHKSEQLMDMISIIEKELGKKAEIDFQPMQPGDVKESFADIKISEEKLGYHPNTNIETGIVNFINWYKSYENS